MEGDVELRDHLADAHGLEDDPGASTQLADLDEHNQARAGGASRHGSTPPLPSSTSTRVYDPRADDQRWRVLVLGVGGLLVVAGAAYAVLLG